MHNKILVFYSRHLTMIRGQTSGTLIPMYSSKLDHFLTSTCRVTWPWGTQQLYWDNFQITYKLCYCSSSSDYLLIFCNGLLGFICNQKLMVGFISLVNIIILIACINVYVFLDYFSVIHWEPFKTKYLM